MKDILKNIILEDTDKKINITIDNENIPIPIQSIKKFQTTITLNTPLNTVLKEDILLDASLYYIPYNTADYNNNITTDMNTTTDGYEIEEEKTFPHKVEINSVAHIIIYENNDKIYYEDDIEIKDGDIQCKINNTLPTGEYQASISFSGNKYLESTQMNIVFTVEKRLTTFTFNEKSYYGSPTQNITLSGQLKDSATKKPIKNCIINFDFDGHTYSTQTNISGDAYLDITIPDADPSHCITIENIESEDNNIGESASYIDEYEDSPDFDDDGNIIEFTDENILNEDEYTDNIDVDDIEAFNQDAESDDVADIFTDSLSSTSYILTAYIDNESYYLKDTSIDIVVNKLPTTVVINQISNVENNNITLSGNVIAHYDDVDKNIVYGDINISFDDTDYISNKIKVNKKGKFSATINFNEVGLSSNVSNIVDPIIYNKTLSQQTNIEIDVEDETIHKEDPIVATATVKLMNSSNTVKNGMIVFILEVDDKEIYRYGSQVDSMGRAVFFFNTSRTEVYKIYAKYYGIFGYESSESEIKIIEVVE